MRSVGAVRGWVVVVVVLGLLVVAQSAGAASWGVQPVPVPEAANGSLVGVSCVSASACTAVGDYTNTAGTRVTLAEVWNGTAWRVTPTPNPAGALSSHLSGVSCVSASACTAVGYYTTNTCVCGGTRVTLAEVWNGTAWQIKPTPNPVFASSSILSGVSCVSTSACTAVGGFICGGDSKCSGTHATLVEVWNGAAWQITPSSNPAGGPAELSGVSCVSASACTAVGHYGDATLAEAWNGTAWQVTPTPNPAGARSSSLSGVSCVSAGACTAAGVYTNSGGTRVTLAEVWNGTAWRVTPTPNPAGARYSSLSGVSCVSASACTAAGGYVNTGDLVPLAEVPLVEVWNGKVWQIKPTPNPAGALSSPLGGVSCVSASACTAAGDSTLTNANHSAGIVVTLVEVWNGTAWQITPTPNPAGALSSSLGGVSCASASACTAVGAYTRRAGTVVTLAEVWNGKVWQIKPTPELVQRAVQLSVRGVVRVGERVHRRRRLCQQRWDRGHVGGGVERDGLAAHPDPEPRRRAVQHPGRGVVRVGERVHRRRRIHQQRRDRGDAGGGVERDDLAGHADPEPL